MKTKKIYQGIDTDFGGGSLYILLKTNIEDLSGYSAVLNIGGIIKTFADLGSYSGGKVPFNLSAEQTAALPLGFVSAQLTITDTDGKTFKGICDTVFEVKRMEDLENE